MTSYHWEYPQGIQPTGNEKKIVVIVGNITDRQIDRILRELHIAPDEGRGIKQ